MADTTMMDASQPLFEGCTFTIIPTTLTQDRVIEISQEIEEYGGIVKSFDIDVGRITGLEELDYIVSATTDFPDYYRALDLMIHVVKPAWVEDSLRINKIKNPRTYSPDPVLFLSDVVVCCGDGIPEGDKEAIFGGVLAMGGQYGTQLSKLTTHLIALSMEDPRCEIAVKKRLNIKIVLPHWFNDCLKVGWRVNERPYLLPDPEIMNVEAGAMPPTTASADIKDATNPEPVGPPASAPAHLAQPRAIKAFDGKKVMLGEDLDLNKDLKEVLAGMIRAGGGSMTNNVGQADIYVCNYRKGDDYVKASQADKDVGNLSWLYFMITHDKWTNPMRRMMHYPRPPPPGIGNFKNYKISISSYTGEARVYLENLIKALGAEFTRTFKQDNTHLITAHRNSEKCEAAEEWGVNIVNHLWLEDSYAECKEKSLTSERYTYFPPRMNMGDILGATEINREAVKKMYFSKGRKKDPEAMSYATAGVGRSHTDGEAQTPLGGKAARRTKTAGDGATPARGRFDGKENETPGTTGSRGAKDRALSSLHDVMEDANQYQKEAKRKGGVIHGGRRRKEDEIVDKEKRKGGRESTASKRSIDDVEADDASTEEETEETAQKSKKARKAPPIKYRMLVSGDKRWQGEGDKESKDKGRLREIGLFILDEPKKVDLLCAPKVVRTLKFVAALADGPQLVGSEYLDYAIKHKQLPDAKKYPLDYSEFRKQHGIDLSDAITRAKQNKHRLLKDFTIFCTEKAKFDVYKEIVAVNGGKCLKWDNRTTAVTASKRKIESQPKEVSQNLEEDEGDVLYLISELQKTEVKLWTKFRELAKKHDMVPRIVSTEWLLNVAMAQKIHWKPEWELKEEDVSKK
ncbi:regulator of Ty1 Transposition [Paraconiothyrium brasiliense]|uniref:Regulator of Ty1 Transposition n=1 Tax=Paraconiothyrium brasiliense TaxID=300254 RepID=A0ABR3RTI9_9PLEO